MFWSEFLNPPSLCTNLAEKMNILHFQDSYIVSNEQEISHSVSHYAPQGLKVTLSCDFFPTRLSTI